MTRGRLSLRIRIPAEAGLQMSLPTAIIVPFVAYLASRCQRQHLHRSRRLILVRNFAQAMKTGNGQMPTLVRIHLTDARLVGFLMGEAAASAPILQFS